MSAPGGFREDVARLKAAWDEVSHEAKVRRAALALAVALGVTVTAARSLVFAMSPGFSWWFFPDARVPALFTTAALTALYAAAGRRQRRVQLLYFVFAVLLVFHLEAATVHWFTEYDGSITGRRVDVVAVAASIVALASVVALHGDVEAAHLAAELRQRGLPAAEASAAGEAQARAALRRAGWLAGFAVALAAGVALAEAPLGEASVGPAYAALAAGLVALVGAAYFALKAVRPARA